MPRRIVSRAATHKSPTRKRPSKAVVPGTLECIGEIDLSPQAPGPTDAQLAIQAILRRGEAARHSIAEFYELVIKHEKTKRPLKPAPHQKVQFSFIEHHRKSVHRIPIGMGKTFGAAAITLWLIGRDPTTRGAILSKIQLQAQKPISMVSDYITEPSLNPPLIVAFPNLRRSPRPQDPWTVNRLTVERPPGIRDPTLVAVGLDGAIGGTRLDWLVADDTVDLDNSSTPEVRDKARSNLESRALSRLENRTGRAVFTNTPWDPKDLTYYLEKESGWPTCHMDIYGYIKITNADASWLHMAEQEFLIPCSRKGYYRLKEHGPDPDELIPLWPERMSVEEIAEERREKMPHEFARLFLCEPFDADSARCHRDWVEKCKKAGIGTSLVHRYDGKNPVFTGIDLAIGTKGKHDLTVFFTFELLPDGRRRILDIESGHLTGPAIIDKIGDLHNRYGSVIVVESNSAQDYIRQFAQKRFKDIVIKAHTTSKMNKTSEDFGVETIFTELRNEAWIIPCDLNGRCHPEVEKWIDDMLLYMPHAHTGDHLMASWIARERARRHGHNDSVPTPGKKSRWAQASAGGFF